MQRSIRTLAAALLAAGLLAGCEPLSLAALGVGGTAAVNHRMSGAPSRSFTAPIAKVRSASLAALSHMGIKTDRVSATKTGEVITARGGKREIEVELEAVTAKTTRVTVVAKESAVVYDASTANEIIEQTAKQLRG